MSAIEQLEFNNRFATLGVDFFTRLAPTAFEKPFTVSVNPVAAELIGLDVKELHSSKFRDYFSGKKIIPGGDYLASVYSGHQFGHYVPQLGDGRAIMIGEVNGYEIQLKGSGKTPYSRFGDGRAVMRSCIREYLCSEAMHNLGIPTTRALCIIGSDENVQRETVEKAAMLTRLSPSHIRFGHFEYFYYTDQHDKLRELADFTIREFYNGANYEEFYEEVVLRTAKLMAKWQAVGFAHGVMNTDNMSILGLTIDYGPFGFVEEYNESFISNHSDTTGRYAFNQQPSIGLWNLYALAQALSPIISEDKITGIVQKYQQELVLEYSSLMRKKMGFNDEKEEDRELLREILIHLENNKMDYTNFFRKFSGNTNLRDEFIDREGYDSWLKRYQKRGGRDEKLMISVNPKYILRNYLAQNAINEAVTTQNFAEIDKLLAILQKPYDEQSEMEEYAKEPPEWGKKLEISCSS